MHASKRLRLLTILLIPLGLYACLSKALISPRWTWQQKATITVTTPNGKRQASSILRGSLID